jgi:hypothetical protein
MVMIRLASVDSVVVHGVMVDTVTVRLRLRNRQQNLLQPVGQQQLQQFQFMEPVFQINHVDVMA